MDVEDFGPGDANAEDRIAFGGRKARSGSLKEAVLENLVGWQEFSNVISGTCMWCKELVSGASTRLAHHLTRTSGHGIAICGGRVPDRVVKRLNDLQGGKSKAASVTTGTGTAKSSGTILKSGQGSNVQQPKQQRNGDIRAAFDKAEAAEIHASVAAFFFGTGLAFDIVNNPLFKKMCSAISNSTKEYAPPSSFQLRTSLLRNEKIRIKDSLKVFCLLCFNSQQC